MLAKLKTLGLALVQDKASLATGVVLGYAGHPVIKLVIDALKGLLG